MNVMEMASQLLVKIKSILGISKEDGADEAHAAIGIGAKTPYHSVTKIIGLVLATCLSCVSDKTKVIGNINGIVSLSGNVFNIIKDLALDIFGVDVSGNAELHTIATELETEGKKYTAATNKQFRDTMVTEAKTWVANTERFIRSVRSAELNTSVLISLVSAVSKRITDIDQVKNDVRSRPVPAAVYFYSPRGYGKTDYINHYLIPNLNRAFNLEGSRKDIYDLSSGKYFRLMNGEAWAVFDEFGAVTSDKEVMDPSTLNKILSGGNVTLPGAALETKLQTASFNGVFLAANRPIDEVPSNFTPEASAAFKSRFSEIRVNDPQYREEHRGGTRTNQPHRRPDYSHLNFYISTAVPLELPGRFNPHAREFRTTAAGVVQHVINLIRQHQQRFDAANQAENLIVAPEAGFELWQPSNDVAHVNRTDVSVFWVAGKPGIGKTETIIPILVTTMEALGIPVRHTMIPNHERRTCYILDDIVNTETMEGQQEFLDFYNELNYQDIVVVISNYGCHERFPSYGRLSEIPRVKNLIPGFMRRTSMQTAFHYEYSPGTFTHYTNGNVDLHEFISHIAATVINIHVKPVARAPPSDVDYDFDLTLKSENPSVSDVIPALTSGLKSPSYATLIPQVSNLMRTIGIAESNEVLIRIGRFIVRQYPNVKVRVVTPSRAYGFIDNTLYMSNPLGSGIDFLTPESAQITWGESEYNITKQMVYDVRMKRVSDFSDPAMTALMALKTEAPHHWDTLKNYYGLPITDKITLVHQYVQAKTSALLDYLFSRPSLLVFLVVFGFSLWWCCKQVDNGCACKGKEGDCPFNDYAFAKGKNKRGRGRRTNYKHFKSIIFNGMHLYEDDVVGHPIWERIWHEVHNKAKKGLMRASFEMGTTSFDAFYSEDDARWVVTTMDQALVKFEESRIIRAAKSNTKPISAANGTMWAFGVDDRTFVVPAHLLLIGGPYIIDKYYKATLQYADSAREIAIFRTSMPVPGVVNVRKYIPELDVIREVNDASIIFRREGMICSATGSYSFQETPYPKFSCQALKDWGLNAGLISYGNIKIPSVPGDCGSPVIGHIGSELYIIGVHAGIREGQQKYATVVLCKELLNIAASAVPADEAHSNEYTVPVAWAPNFATSRTEVLKDLKDCFTNPKGAVYHPEGAVRAVAYMNNAKPMDSRDDRIYYGHFPATLEGFPEKSPALPEVDIYDNHKDKIPTDAAGLYHPFLIRTKRLESNTFDVGKYKELALLGYELGDMYSLMLKDKPTFLSVDTALNGSGVVQPIDLSTSAGVIIPRLIGGGIKRDYISDSRFTPAVDRMIQSQWSKAHRAIRLSFPADANYKAELLPNQKVWKKRIFYNVPLPTVVNLKRILGPVQAEFIKMGVKSPYLFSIYPLRDWNDLAQELLKVGGAICCLDVSGYDHSVNGATIMSVAPFIVAIYKDSDNVLIHTMFEEIAFMPLLFKNTIVVKEGGLPSGTWGTSLIDAVAWEIMLVYIWKRKTNTSIHHYKNNVCAKFVGDDLIFSVSPEFKHVFNSSTVAESMMEFFNIKCTPPTKDGKILPYTSIEEAMFCSRSFVRHPNHLGTFLPCLKKESIYGALSYSRYTHPHDLYEQYIAVRYEIMPYGRTIYNKFEKELSVFAHKNKINHVPMPYAQALEETWKVMVSPSEDFQRCFLHWFSKIGETQDKMSSTKIRELRKRIFDAILDKKDPKPEDVRIIREINELGLIDWKDTFQLHRPGNQDQYECFKSLNTTAAALLCREYGGDWCSIFERWTRALLPDIVTEKATRYIGIRNAHLALLDYLESGVIQEPLLWFADGRPRDNHLMDIGVESRLLKIARLSTSQPRMVDHDLDQAHCDWAEIDMITDQMLEDLSVFEYENEVQVTPSLEDHNYSKASDSNWLEMYDYHNWLKTGQPYLDSSHSSPAANLPETSAAEGGVEIIGKAMGDQMDPLMAPTMTMTPAVATSSQEIADSDNAAVGPVLETMGGLPPEALQLTNYSDNIVSLCSKPIYVRRYNVTSNTAAGTIIDEIPFNPWDQTLVTTPIAQYGSLHSIFSGSIDIYLNSYSAATIVGSVILSYVPPLLQKNFVPDLANLKTVPSTVLNLKIGGSCRLVVNGGNLKDCAISREELEAGTGYYGKIYIAAYTDIVNAYGVAVSIPIVRLAALGAGAYFSHPKYLTGGSTTNPLVHPGPQPPISEDLILDSSVKYIENPTYSSDLAYFPLTATANGFELFPAINQDDLTLTFPGLQNLEGSTYTNTTPIQISWWYGHNEYGTSLNSIDNAISYTDRWAASIPFGLTTDPQVVYFRPGPGFPYGKDGTSLGWSYTGVNISVNTAAGDTYMAFPETKGDSTYGRLYDLLNPDYTAVSATIKIHKLNDSSGSRLYVDSSYRSVVRTFILDVENPTPITRLSESLTSGTSDDINSQCNLTFRPSPSYVSVAGAPVLTEVLNNDLEAAPAGYVAIYFNDDAAFIPAVDATISNLPSLPSPTGHNRFMAQVRTWFKVRTDVFSYSYDMSFTSGEIIGTVLVNTEGCFVYIATAPTDAYYVLPNASTVQYSNYIEYTELYPTIQEVTLTSFVNRVYTASLSRTFGYKGLDKKFHVVPGKDNSNTSLRLQYLEDRLAALMDKPQAAWALVGVSALGGAASATGGALAQLGQWSHEKQLAALRAGTAMGVARLNAKGSIFMAKLKKDVLMGRYGYGADVTMGGNQYGNSYVSAVQASPQTSMGYMDIGVLPAPGTVATLPQDSYSQRATLPQAPGGVSRVTGSTNPSSPTTAGGFKPAGRRVVGL
jgi:hypothetical protein